MLLYIDSKEGYPNIALKKIEKYWSDKGAEIVYDFPLLRDQVDKIYVSCIYDWNRDKCKEWEGIADIGGSGYDLEKTLPSEIDKIKPKIIIGFLPILSESMPKLRLVIDLAIPKTDTTNPI